MIYKIKRHTTKTISQYQDYYVHSLQYSDPNIHKDNYFILEKYTDPKSHSSQQNTQKKIIQYLLITKIFMEETIQSTNTSHSQQVRHFHSLSLLFFHNIQTALRNALDVLDHEHAICILNMQDKQTHFIYCKLAESHHALHNYQKALSNAQLGLKLKNSCASCLNIAFQSFQKLVNYQKHLLKEVQIEQFKSTQEFFLWKRKIIESQTTTKISTFLQQLNKNGANFSKIQLVQDSPQYRKIVAKQGISKDEVIMFIPKKQLITLETAKQSVLVGKIQQKKVYLRSPKHCLLSIYLLQQKELGKNSPYYLYIDLLPSNFTNFPLNYTEKQKNQLIGSAFLEQIQQKAIDMKKDYQSICEIDPNFSRFSFQQFQWARMTVCSRIFGIAINNIKTDALVPLADMLNHHIPKQTSWFYSDHDQGFVIKSMKNLEAGSEVFDSYGHKCNSRFLLNYGFTICENPSNQVSIIIPINTIEADIITNRQVYLRISKQLQTKEFQDLIGVARFAVLNEEQIKQIQYSGGNPQNTLYQSDDNEIKAWELLITIFSRHLQQYPTTYREDIRLLTQKNISQNIYNCIVLRMGEKQILLFYIDMAKIVIRFIQTHRKNNLLKIYEPYLLNLPYY